MPSDANGPTSSRLLIRADTRTSTLRALCQDTCACLQYLGARNCPWCLAQLGMLLSNALLASTLVGLTAVNASPLSRSTGKTTLALTARIDEGVTLSLIEKDQARARILQNPDQLWTKGTSFNVTNSIFVYSTQVGVGSPPVTCMWISRRFGHLRLSDCRFAFN